MEIKVEINDKIYEDLTKHCIERGLTLNELIRSMLGEYHHAHCTVPAFNPPLVFQKSPAEDKFLKILEVLVTAMINSGELKCANCTQPLTVEDLMNGVCGKCKEAIGLPK